MAEIGDAHKNHCFVVMPYGRNSEEKKWFAGWYDVVIKRAIEECGYEAILAAAEDQPGAINDEIRAHLALDEMVIVDLAGRNPDDPPNPNVMYEPGIRHAFGLPTVLMAWDGQTLPFDVGNQRAIMCQRGFKDIEPTKKKLISFMEAAKYGRYYKPMEAVSREAALDSISVSLDEDSTLAALVSEIRYLKDSLNYDIQRRERFSRKRPASVKRVMGRGFKSELWPLAQQHGYDSGSWGKILSMKLDEETCEAMSDWDMDEWAEFLRKNKPLEITHNENRPESPSAMGSTLSAAFVDAVDELLGEQPWPSGVAKDVAEKLEVSTSKVSRAIKTLMHSGRRKYQADGLLYDSEYQYLQTRTGNEG